MAFQSWFAQRLTTPARARSLAGAALRRRAWKGARNLPLARVSASKVLAARKDTDKVQAGVAKHRKSASGREATEDGKVAWHRKSASGRGATEDGKNFRFGTIQGVRTFFWTIGLCRIAQPQLARFSMAPSRNRPMTVF